MAQKVREQHPRLSLAAEGNIGGFMEATPEKSPSLPGTLLHPRDVASRITFGGMMPPFVSRASAGPGANPGVAFNLRRGDICRLSDWRALDAGDQGGFR
jgi:hypothetical protein